VNGGWVACGNPTIHGLAIVIAGGGLGLHGSLAPRRYQSIARQFTARVYSLPQLVGSGRYSIQRCVSWLTTCTSTR
jgi:hypothetical protein